MREIVYLNVLGAELFIGTVQGTDAPFLRMEEGRGFVWGRWVVLWDRAWWTPAR